MSMKKKYVILFVCTGNTCRSPMAEGALRTLLEKKRPDKFEVISAGTAAASGFPATIFAIEAAKIWDTDLAGQAGHHSQPLTRRLIEKSDLILAMTPSHLREVIKISPDASDRTYLFKNFPDANPEGEPVEDPIGQSLERYNEGEYLGQILAEIVKRIDEKSDAG